MHVLTGLLTELVQHVCMSVDPMLVQYVCNSSGWYVQIQV